MSVPSTESFTNPDSRQQTFDIELDRGSSGKAAQQQISMQQPAAATLWRRVLGVLCVAGRDPDYDMRLDRVRAVPTLGNKYT